MFKKPKILVIGSFVMDLTVSTQKFPNSGETVFGESFQTAPGGKAPIKRFRLQSLAQM